MVEPYTLSAENLIRNPDKDQNEGMPLLAGFRVNTHKEVKLRVSQAAESGGPRAEVATGRQGRNCLSPALSDSRGLSDRASFARAPLQLSTRVVRREPDPGGAAAWLTLSLAVLRTQTHPIRKNNRCIEE